MGSENFYVTRSQSTCERVSWYLWCLRPYLKLLLLFLTLPLALGQSRSVLLFHHHSSLCFQGMKLGLSWQFCCLAVGGQLQLLKPVQVISLLDRQLRWGRHGCIPSWWQRGRSHHQQHSNKQEDIKFRKQKCWNSISEGGFVQRNLISLLFRWFPTALSNTHFTIWCTHLCGWDSV